MNTQKPGPKLVVIGVGSSNFGPPMLLDLLANVARNGATLSLVDIDAEKLAVMEGVARKLAQHLGCDAHICASAERREVLADADFVFISAEVERIACWQKDWEIVHALGVPDPLAENRGPAGLSHSLRTVPLVLEIARDVEALAPKATLIILTNPEDRLAYAVNRYTNVQAIGYCDGLWDFKDHNVGPALGLPGEDIHVEGAGINHAVWITDIRRKSTGEDLLPRLLEASQTDGWQPFGRHLYETYGLWPHENDEHYGEYFPYACEFMACKGYDYAGHLQDAEVWRQRNIQLVQGGDVEAYLADVNAFVQHVFGDNPPSHIPRGVHFGENTYLPNTNIPNRGKVPGAPADMVVEVPALATLSGVRGVKFEKFPDPIVSFLYREGTIQKLAAEAAAEGSRPKALQALLLDPHVRSVKLAEELLEAFLEAHRPFIPEANWAGLRGLR